MHLNQKSGGVNAVHCPLQSSQEVQESLEPGGRRGQGVPGGHPGGQYILGQLLHSLMVLTCRGQEAEEMVQKGGGKGGQWEGAGVREQQVVEEQESKEAAKEEGEEEKRGRLGEEEKEGEGCREEKERGREGSQEGGGAGHGGGGEGGRSKGWGVGGAITD